MQTHIHFDSMTRAWSRVWRRFSTGSKHGCIHSQRVWRRFGAKAPAVSLDGFRYCIDQCLEQALRDALQRTRSLSKQTGASHRIPLGLVLLSRQHITAEQLRAALDAQRNAGRGRIGEWLEALGFTNEQQITTALARQWSCPVLRHSFTAPTTRVIPQIPIALLEGFAMVPVDFVEAQDTLHVAFGEGIDYSVLYAIEQMIGCHTEPCMALPSFVRSSLQALSDRRPDREVVFEHIADITEFSRIICSYCTRLSAYEIRLSGFGTYIWVRLLRRSFPPHDLLLRSPLASPSEVRPRFAFALTT
jgi:hypothetical protein